MKISNLLIAVMAASVLATSCGSTAPTTSSTTPTAPAVSAAYTNGQLAGTSLKTLYGQYKAEGKLNLSNVSNLLAMVSLSTSIQGLKNQTKDTDFYKDFALGLAVGSSNLVTPATSNTVMTGLTSLAGMDFSTITSLATAAAANATPTQTTAPVQTVPATTTPAGTAASVLSSTSDVINSVSGILSLFAK